jgi:hypothetical protein
MVQYFKKALIGLAWICVFVIQFLIAYYFDITLFYPFLEFADSHVFDQIILQQDGLKQLRIERKNAVFFEKLIRTASGKGTRKLLNF